MKKAPTLMTIEITNEEYGRASELYFFLQFLKDESAPIPETVEETDKLLARYILKTRRENMERLPKREKNQKKVDKL